jgi:hypothetical protein
MTELENPVAAARRKLGLSRHDVAIMGGIGTIYLYNAERGATTRVPDGIVRVFEQLGIDGDELQAQYAEWREIVGRQKMIEARSAQGIVVR